MKPIHWVLIFVGLLVVGVGAYFLFFRRKSTTVPPPPKPTQTSAAAGALGFAENLGKKALGDALNSLFS